MSPDGGAIDMLLRRGAGPVNLAAPNPQPNADFMCALREAWGTPFGLPASRWMLDVGAHLLRTETELNPLYGLTQLR